MNSPVVQSVQPFDVTTRNILREIYVATSRFMLSSIPLEGFLTRQENLSGENSPLHLLTLFKNYKEGEFTFTDFVPLPGFCPGVRHVCLKEAGEVVSTAAKKFKLDYRGIPFGVGEEEILPLLKKVLQMHEREKNINRIIQKIEGELCSTLKDTFDVSEEILATLQEFVTSSCESLKFNMKEQLLPTIYEEVQEVSKFLFNLHQGAGEKLKELNIQPF